MGFLKFEPKSISDSKENNCSLNLEMSYSKLELNDKIFFTRIEMIFDILKLKDPPSINENCTDCHFVQNQKL